MEEIKNNDYEENILEYLHKEENEEKDNLDIEEENQNIDEVDTLNESNDLVEFKFGNEIYKINKAFLNKLKEIIKPLQTFKIEKLAKLIEEKSEELKNKKKVSLKEQQELNLLLTLLNEYSNNFLLLHKTFQELLENKEYKTDINYTYNKKIIDSESGEETTEKITIKDSYPTLKHQKGVILDKKTSLIYPLIRSKSIKKVILPNSGVYILLKSPNLSELNILYNKIIDAIGEYGYMFGNYFYLFHDFYIKEEFLDMIKDFWIIDTNISSWKKGNTLYENISIHDYSTILHGLASLMFKSGYDYTFICPNCKYKETVTIDLNLLKRYILSSIPEKAIEFLNDKSLKSSKELLKYREKYLDLEKSVQITKYHKLTLKVPTIDEYMKYGNRFNSEMTNIIHNTSSLEKINNFIRYSYFKLFTPWIKSIEYLDNEGNTDFIIQNVEGIELALTRIQDEFNEVQEKLLEPILDFIKFSSLTLLAIPLNPCPKCNTIPENTIKGLLPIDIQEHFFSMSAMRLSLK